MNKYSRRPCCVDATVLSPFPKEAVDTHTNKQQVESLIAGGSKAALASQASGRQLLTSSAANKLVAEANHLPTGPGSVSSCVK